MKGGTNYFLCSLIGLVSFLWLIVPLSLQAGLSPREFLQDKTGNVIELSSGQPVATWEIPLTSEPSLFRTGTNTTNQKTFLQPIYHVTQITNNPASILPATVSLLGQTISSKELEGTAVTLGEKTTGTYQKSTTGGNGISIEGSEDEGWTAAIGLDDLTGNWSQHGSGDIVLANSSSELKILGSDGGHYATLDVGSLGDDATFTLTGESGTLLTSVNYSSYITSLSGALQAANNLSDLASTTTARTNLGLGSIATQNASNVTITGGSGTFGTLTGTTVNGLTITNNGSNTLNISAGKTAVITNSLTLSGTDGTTLTFPSSSDTIAGLTATQTLTNKTIAAGSNAITGLTNSNLSGSAGITNANLANATVTITAGSGLSGGGSVSLGSSVSLSLPQSVATGSSPSFASLNITNTSNQIALGTTNIGTLTWAPSTTRTLTLPDATDTLVGKATTDILTNKTLAAPTINGTVATTGLTLPAFTASGNITGSGSPAILSFGAINGLTFTANSTGFSVAGGTTSKTLTISNSLTLAGTDGTTLTFPSSSGTVVTLDASQTLTNKTLTAPVISSISNTGTLTLPTSTDTLIGRATTDTLTNKTIAGGSNTVTGIPLAYANTSTPAGDTIANTTTETAFASSYTIPANTLLAGNVVRIKLWGVYSNAITPPTVVGKVKLGGTEIGTTGTITGGAAASNAGWSAEISIVVRTAGAGGTVDVQGYLEFATAATAALSINSPNAATIALDTTVNQDLTTTIKWGTASASNTITLRQITVEILK